MASRPPQLCRRSAARLARARRRSFARAASSSCWPSPVAGRPGELRLVAPDAQIAFTADRAATLRSIIREASCRRRRRRRSPASAAPSTSPARFAGESETQIFLLTADGRPVSLTVLRRPGETPVWAVALSEIVDEAAAPPAPRHLALVPARLQPAAAPCRGRAWPRPMPRRRRRSRRIIGWCWSGSGRARGRAAGCVIPAKPDLDESRRVRRSRLRRIRLKDVSSTPTPAQSG